MLRFRNTLPRLLLLRTLAFLLAANFSASAQTPDQNYLIGRAIRNITGPCLGVPMFGYVRADQIAEGIHIRLWSRAFIIAEPPAKPNSKRIAFVVVDMGSVMNEIQRGVVDILKKKYGDLYTLDNVIISATHTHSGPSGYWHFGADTPFGAPFYQQHWDAIVQGIANSIIAAHEDLQPGQILINKDNLENAGWNRSAVAYDSDPPEERAKYDSNTDKDMTLLKFVGAKGPIAEINWFAVHPTSMTFFNKLVSGDHKGYAAQKFEQSKGSKYAVGNLSKDDFVAAFAQTNCGDVTPNSNLDNTGPGDPGPGQPGHDAGKHDFESTKILGDRQLQKAVELFDGAKGKLQGGIDYRHTYIDFSQVSVGDEFTHMGPQSTCPSALGYAFAAGSTEDGGGHPLFHEGMLKQEPFIDGLISQFAPVPSEACRACQAPKPILIATGEGKPPLEPQVVPLTVVKIGQLVLICGPAEYTTMSGRCIRDSVGKVFGDAAKYLVVAAYSNDYIGYVTTREEYQTQQYEGGHTPFGPWTLAAFQQEFSKLSKAIVDGKPVESVAVRPDMRGQVKSTTLGTPFDPAPDGQELGAIAKKPIESYKKGELVEVAFWTGNPGNDYKTGNTYLTIEQKTGNDAWTRIDTDNDWSTKCRWTQPTAPPKIISPYAMAASPKAAKEGAPPKVDYDTFPWQITITWEIPADAQPGTYRITHFGSRKKQDGKIEEFNTQSPGFKVE